MCDVGPLMWKSCSFMNRENVCKMFSQEICNLDCVTCVGFCNHAQNVSKCEENKKWIKGWRGFLELIINSDTSGSGSLKGSK